MRIATWNINSVRLRIAHVLRFIKEQNIDVMCLQETKTQDEFFPKDELEKIGFKHQYYRGEKSYNGVAIVSKFEFTDTGYLNWCEKDDTRHIYIKLNNNIEIHNFYVPAGGDEPDRERNEKFDQKLSYLSAMEEYFCKNQPRKSILVGDLNIAPLPEDVWDHKKMAKIVSHTQVEIDHLDAVQRAGNWVDVTRKDIPKQKLYSWWSYRAKDWNAADRGRRLDHIWAQM